MKNQGTQLYLSSKFCHSAIKNQNNTGEVKKKKKKEWSVVRFFGNNGIFQGGQIALGGLNKSDGPEE